MLARLPFIWLAIMAALTLGVACDTGPADRERTLTPTEPAGLSPPGAVVRAPTSTPTPWPTPIPLSLTSEPGIYFVSRDGSDFRRLVAGDIFRADLSPDGTEVIYSREMEIVAMNIQTSITRVVASGPVANPMWSATGRYITFSMYGEERSAWLVRPDGSGLQRL